MVTVSSAIVWSAFNQIDKLIIHDSIHNSLLVYDTSGAEFCRLEHEYDDITCFSVRKEYILGCCKDELILWKLSQKSLVFVKSFTNVVNNDGSKQ